MTVCSGSRLASLQGVDPPLPGGVPHQNATQTESNPQENDELFMFLLASFNKALFC
jgi:hypothetical protein